MGKKFYNYIGVDSRLQREMEAFLGDGESMSKLFLTPDGEIYRHGGVNPVAIDAGKMEFCGHISPDVKIRVVSEELARLADSHQQLMREQEYQELVKKALDWHEYVLDKLKKFV